MSVYIVTHKDYEFPAASIYQPIRVGSAKIDKIKLSDAEGSNISELNPYFCELTALYWIWRNYTDDLVGLVHYRRYFSAVNRTLSIQGKNILSEKDILSLMNEYDLIVAKPRNYIFIKIKDHYIKAHGESDFNILRQEIITKKPDYIEHFDAVMNSREISLYNMFIGKREVIDKYCHWLFGLLFSIKDRIPYETYDPYQRRVFGFMAERLFNVWVRKHRSEINVKEHSVVNIEGENIIRKGIGLIKRQYF